MARFHHMPILCIPPPGNNPKVGPLVVQSIPIYMVNFKPFGRIKDGAMHIDVVGFPILPKHSPGIESIMSGIRVPAEPAELFKIFLVDFCETTLR
jgi:hypothetical protein